MTRKPRKAITRSCPNESCEHFGKLSHNNIHPHGWYKTKHGRRRRYRCSACGKSFGSTRSTVYHRLKGSRQEVEQTCQLSAEGVSIATISRTLRRAWNTINRWLKRARIACKKFLDRHLKNYPIRELQADEIKPFVDSRKSKTWIMADIEVSTRLWPTTRVGKRSYKNIREVFRDTFKHGLSDGRVLITTDGYKPYSWVIKRMLGPTCLYGQVIKKWKNNRVTKVTREIVIGEPWQIKHALECSEDSETINTSFIERLNLTIRRNTSYLHRQTPAHARCGEALEAQLDLQRCFYNFLRPHMALKFGKETWTPAMMAGLATHVLTWREVLSFYIFVWFHVREAAVNGDDGQWYAAA
jgi:transposase-like protein/IS1 family transposase